ncbi:hypothetical protein [Phytohabitans aurantiacus]|uniref:Uncharacterized protein n=1 Tax=Phytohabitans aurantiacus TaxID=3016789 RepID=A0ABQ5QSQ8_9ACTN|nr:hypothetical protein [Phytohabitans aurantiacus]GLH97325.1 hypothetical protein Pa4123_26000 [Phytohabitans aurantiacus]
MTFTRRLVLITSAVFALFAIVWVAGVALAPGPIPWGVAAVGVIAPVGAAVTLLLNLRADQLRAFRPRRRRARAAAGLEAPR